MQRFIKSFANDAAIQAAVDDKSLGKPYVALDDELHKIDWDGKDPGFIAQYLTIEIISGTEMKIERQDVFYSINGGEWIEGPSDPANFSLSVNPGDKIRFKGYNGGAGLFMHQKSALQHIAYGNVESLEYGDDFIGKKEIKNTAAFKDMFHTWYLTGLQSIENVILPATSLTEDCYNSMFRGIGNSGLRIKAPLLPAPILTQGCYYEMFTSGINYIKCLATDLTAENCLTNWLTTKFYPPTGTFVKKAGVNWPTGANGIPSGWTVIEE